LGAVVLSRAGSFLLIPLYTRRLTLEEYGQYALFLTLLAFLSTFLSAGLVAAIPRAYFSEQNRTEGLRRAAEVARWLALISIGGAAILLIGVEHFASADSTALLGRDSLRLAVLGGAGTAISAVPWTLLRSEQRAYAASAFQLLQLPTLTGAGVLLVLVLNRGYTGAIEAAALTPVVTGLVSLFYIARLPRSGLHFTRLRRALRFALPFVPHFVAQWLLGAADLWILEKFGFQQELGRYSIAVQVVVPVNMVITAWNLHVGPEMGERFRAGGLAEMRKHLVPVRLSYLAAAAIPGAALMVGLPAVRLAIGPEFGTAIAYVPLLLLAILPDTVYFADMQVVYYSRRSSWIGAATVTAAFANISIGWLVIPLFGAYGAVVARLAGALLRSLIIVRIGREASDPSTRKNA